MELYVNTEFKRELSAVSEKEWKEYLNYSDIPFSSSMDSYMKEDDEYANQEKYNWEMVCSIKDIDTKIMVSKEYGLKRRLTAAEWLSNR